MKQESGIILNSHCAVKCSLQTNILFMASWSKTVTVLVYTLRNGTRPPNDKKIASNCHLEHLFFLRYFLLHKALLKCLLRVSKVSLGHLIELSVKRELIVLFFLNFEAFFTLGI